MDELVQAFIGNDPYLLRFYFFSTPLHVITDATGLSLREDNYNLDAAVQYEKLAFEVAIIFGRDEVRKEVVDNCFVGF